MNFGNQVINLMASL